MLIQVARERVWKVRARMQSFSIQKGKIGINSRRPAKGPAGRREQPGRAQCGAKPAPRRRLLLHHHLCDRLSLNCIEDTTRNCWTCPDRTQTPVFSMSKRPLNTTEASFPSPIP